MALHGVTNQQLDGWIKAHRSGGGFSPVVTRRRPGRGITRCKVSTIRRVLAILDMGGSVSLAAFDQKLPRTSVRRWRDNPEYREATFEFNPDFNYDHEDLIDRSIVAHALCKAEPNPDERLDLMLAIVGLHREDEPKEHQKLFGNKNRKGAQ